MEWAPSSADATTLLPLPTYYVSIQGQTKGPYRTEYLRRIPGFTLQTPVRLSPLDPWKPAFTTINLKAYFSGSPSDTGDQSYTGTQKEKAKAQRREQKRLFILSMKRYFHGLLIMLIFCAILSGIGYLELTGQIKPHVWRQQCLNAAHENIRVLIQFLDRVDRQYLTPAPAVTTPHPASANVKKVPHSHKKKRLRF
jgi:hypothetical protein